MTLLNVPVIDIGPFRGRLLFHDPNDEALIEYPPTCRDPEHSPRCKATTAGEHLREQIVLTQNALTPGYTG